METGKDEMIGTGVKDAFEGSDGEGALLQQLQVDAVDARNIRESY